MKLRSQVKPPPCSLSFLPMADLYWRARLSARSYGRAAALSLSGARPSCGCSRMYWKKQNIFHEVRPVHRDYPSLTPTGLVTQAPVTIDMLRPQSRRAVPCGIYMSTCIYV
jgi:hypothetical protein